MNGEGPIPGSDVGDAMGVRSIPGTGPILEFEGITKSFFGVKVLEDVSFAVEEGHVVGLVGENGAGKSTLMNVLGGNLMPDAGRMRLDGQIYAPDRPSDAARSKVAFIHQELNLFGNLSVAENLCITDFPHRVGGLWIHRRELRARASRLLEQVGLEVPPETLVERLSPGERQLVEVAKALGMEARLIILDEPTTSLTSRETAHLFGLLERLRSRGVTMIYVSHVLDDVLRLCDAVVVLRDGRVVGNGPRSEFDSGRMITLMVGRSIQQVFPARVGRPSAERVLEVRGLTQPGTLEQVSFELRAGEVLGVAGLMGSGRSELARVLFGLDPVERGEIHVSGRPVLRRSPRDLIARGLAFLTENRREDGLCLEGSIADNMGLAALPGYARAVTGWIDERRLEAEMGRYREAVRLTSTARNEQAVKTLSGGNQQKVVLAKWLLTGPRVFVLDEPTRGIDVGAKSEIYGLIHALAGRGAGILIISSEIEELIGLCDRILVMRRGELSDELERAAFDRERILRSAMDDTSGRDGGEGATGAR